MAWLSRSRPQKPDEGMSRWLFGIRVVYIGCIYHGEKLMLRTVLDNMGLTRRSTRLEVMFSDMHRLKELFFKRETHDKNADTILSVHLPPYLLTVQTCEFVCC